MGKELTLSAHVCTPYHVALFFKKKYNVTLKCVCATTVGVENKNY